MAAINGRHVCQWTLERGAWEAEDGSSGSWYEWCPCGATRGVRAATQPIDPQPCASTVHADPVPAHCEGVFINPASRRETGIAYCLPCAARIYAAGMFCPDDPAWVRDLEAEMERVGV